MTTLEKILHEIEETVERYKNNANFETVDICYGMNIAKKIIKNHLSNNDGWIPVDPNNIPYKEVLCCDEYGEQLIGYLSKTEDGWICESEECTMYYVVGWMPKPEPCRKDGE